MNFMVISDQSHYTQIFELGLLNRSIRYVFFRILSNEWFNHDRLTAEVSTKTTVFWDMFLKYLIDNTLSIITFIFLLSFLFFLFLSALYSYYTPSFRLFIYKLVIFKVFFLPSAYFVLPWRNNPFSGHLSCSQPRSQNSHFPAPLSFTMRMKATFCSETPVLTY
jgi:hypothetical protein